MLIGSLRLPQFPYISSPSTSILYSQFPSRFQTHSSSPPSLLSYPRIHSQTQSSSTQLIVPFIKTIVRALSHLAHTFSALKHRCLRSSHQPKLPLSGLSDTSLLLFHFKLWLSPGCWILLLIKHCTVFILLSPSVYAIEVPQV